MDLKEKLIELLSQYFDVGDSYAYNLTRVKTAFEVGTMSLDDFEEFDENTVTDIADYLIANGVTVQEWIPASQPPKPDNELDARNWYLVTLENGVVKELAYEFREDSIFGFGWRETAYPVTNWMPMPERRKENKR